MSILVSISILQYISLNKPIYPYACVQASVFLHLPVSTYLLLCLHLSVYLCALNLPLLYSEHI